MRQNEVNLEIHSNASLSVEQFESLINLQHTILEATALSQKYHDTLNLLCELSEKLLPNSVASIMILNQQKILEIVAAPNIPLEAVKSLKGLKPGPRRGSCANVIYRQKAQFVVSTLSDVRWSDVREFAIRFKIGACWSVPIYGKQQNIIGTFALSSFCIRQPTSFDRKLIEIAAYLAGIVLERQKIDKKLHHLAFYDCLTDLPNRFSLISYLDHKIKNYNQTKKKFAVLFFDLDRFKHINDIYGHNLGDLVLSYFANRLNKLNKNMKNENLFISRLGGDEFVIVFHNYGSLEAINSFAKSILREIEKPIEIEGHIFYLTSSIGISLFPEHTQESKKLLSHADAAMYEAKRKGSNQYCFYSSYLTDQTVLKFSLEHDLRQAIEKEEFELYYQSKVFNDRHNQFCGAEVLIRWQHPIKGMINPFQFIPLAEEIGLIIPIGEWIIKRVCQQIKQWQQKGKKVPHLSVNLSNRQLNWPSVNNLLNIIERENINPYLLEFEITESYVMENIQEMIPLLEKIHKMGITIALDDFGVGYSSLGILKQLPLNTLKIDKSLIDHIDDNLTDQAIIEAIIKLSKALGLKVIAEGIETQKQKQFLTSLDCDQLQGYYFSQPMPVVEFENSLLMAHY